MHARCINEQLTDAENNQKIIPFYAIKFIPCMNMKTEKSKKNHSNFIVFTHGMKMFICHSFLLNLRRESYFYSIIFEEFM
jgi:hypothetical protein